MLVRIGQLLSLFDSSLKHLPVPDTLTECVGMEPAAIESPASVENVNILVITHVGGRSEIKVARRI